MIFYSIANTRSKRPTARAGRKTRPKAKQSTALTWMLTGLLIGILGVAALALFLSDKNTIKHWLSSQKTVQETRFNKAIVAKAKPATQDHNTRSTNTHTKVGSPKKTPSTPTQERFEFYTILPGMEVPLPETEESPKKSTPAANPHPVATVQSKIAAARYTIQAGAFRTLPSAMRLKTQLSQQGMRTHIQKIEEENGTWFRVNVGPFASESMAIAHKNRLATQNIQGILILQR